MKDDEIRDLIKKIQSQTADTREKDAYIEYLHKIGKISAEKYKEYNSGRNVDHILQLALIAGIAILAGILINKLIENK
jgi:hypothetical protein